MSAGRLDIDEYGDRSAQVSTAKTRGELLGLFADLPAPHPAFGVEPAAPPPPPAQQPVPVSPSMPLRQRVAGAAVPMAVLVALALYFLVAHFWIVFLIPAAVMVFGGAIWGDDWKHQQRLNRDRHRQ